MISFSSILLYDPSGLDCPSLLIDICNQFYACDVTFFFFCDTGYLTKIDLIRDAWILYYALKVLADSMLIIIKLYCCIN